MRNLLLTLTCFLLNHHISGQKVISYPELGISFSLPAETAANELGGIDLLWTYVPEEDGGLEFTIGYVHELDPEYEVENPFEPQERQKGPYPSIDVQAIKGYQYHSNVKEYRFCSDVNYVIRYYFPLGGGYHFMLEFDGYPDDAETDEKFIKDLLSTVRFSKPQTTAVVNRLAKFKADGLVQRSAVSMYKVGKADNLGFCNLSAYGAGKAMVFFPEFDLGTVFALFNEDGDMIKSFNIRQESIFYEVLPERNSFVAVVGELDYGGKYDVYINHSPSLSLNRYSYEGKLLSSTRIMEEVKVRNPTQVGFTYSMANSVSLSSLNGRYIVHYPIISLEKGKVIQRQENVLTYDSDMNQFCPTGALNSIGLTRQGDAIAVIEANGQLNTQLSKHWITYSSLAQQVLEVNQSLHLVTLNGVGKNRGVALKVWDVQSDIRSTQEVCLFPVKGPLVEKESPLLEFSEQVRIGQLNYLAISTDEGLPTNRQSKNAHLGKGYNDIILICYNDAGKLLWKKNLTESSGKEEILPHLSSLGDELLITWSDFGYLDQVGGFVEYYMLVNKQGQIVQKRNPLLTNTSLILKDIGQNFDVSSNDMPNATKLLKMPNGNIVFSRIMPYFYKNYLELVTIKP